MPDDPLGAVLTDGIPAAANKGLDDGGADRCAAGTVVLRPPAVDAQREDLEGSGRGCLHGQGFAYGRNADLAIHVFFPGRIGGDGAASVRIDVVNAACTFGAIADETGQPQRLEVLRYRRTADRKAGREFADRCGCAAQPLEHGAARGIGKRRQCQCVSHDLR